MTELDAKEIKEKLDAIMNHLGIGKLSPAAVVDIRSKAKERAAKLVNQEDKRKQIPDRH